MSAWHRLLRLWRPLSAWSVLVWIVVAAVLSPLSSALLGSAWLRGREEVVGNEALLAWALTPQGLTWLVLAGSLGLVGAVLHFAGIFRVVTDDMEGRPTTLPETALRLTPELPALGRLCAVTVIAGLVAALPLAAGLAGIHELLLGAQDINYYLTERPPAWWYAVGAAAAWGTAWTAAAVWGAGRTALTLPAYLDGHRPLTAALRRSWRATRGEGTRIVRVVGLAVAVWLAVRTVVDATAVAGGAAFLGWVASASESLEPLVAASGGWALLSLALDAAIVVLGIAYLSTLLAKLYHEDTDLHRAVVPSGRDLSERLRAGLGRWLRPRRLFPAAVLALAASAATGAALLERAPDPRPVAVTAHRGGPGPAPENTLAALERAIEAGADWSEVDVQLTRDGVPVLLHDADLLRVVGDPRRISRVDYRELSDLAQRPESGTPPEERRVATLEEFLDRARGRIGVAVELKYYGWDPRLAPAVARVLRERGAADRVMVLSLELRGVRQIRSLAPEIPVGYAAAAAVGDPTRLPVDFLALSRRAASSSLLRTARRRGIPVHIWTVNRARAMAEEIQRGADGLITDRPALAVRVRRELAEMPAVARLLLRYGHLIAEEDEEALDASTL